MACPVQWLAFQQTKKLLTIRIVETKHQTGLTTLILFSGVFDGERERQKDSELVADRWHVVADLDGAKILCDKSRREARARCRARAAHIVTHTI